MGRSPCCEKVGLKKGPWTPEEDQKLLAYIEEHGHGSWRALPAKAGLQRCGKSCRLRWTNYLRPDIKRGKFSLQEEQTIIQLHALLGNRWSAIATHLAKRTDNEIKNYWNTHLKKRLTKMGIDPATHKPKTDALGSSSGNPKDAANLSHMAQWESARLEAEARLVRESKLTNNNNHNNNNNNKLGSANSATPHFKSSMGPPCLDILKAWQGSWSTKSNNYNNSNNSTNNNALLCMLAIDDLESPTSTLNFPDHHSSTTTTATATNLSSVQSLVSFEESNVNDDNHNDNVTFHDILSAFGCTDSGSTHNAWFLDGTLIKNNINNNNHALVDTVTTNNNNNTSTAMSNIMENVTDVFVYTSEDQHNNEEINNGDGIIFDVQENKSYWNSILNLVNANSPSESPVF